MRLHSRSELIVIMPEMLAQLFAADQPDARGKRPSLELAERPKFRGIHIVVHDRRVAAIGGIFHHPAQTKVGSAKMKTPFEAGAKGNIIGEPLSTGRTHHLLIGIHGIEGEAGMPVQRIDEIPILLQFR